MAEQLYKYRWGANGKQRTMKGRTCRVIVRAGRNNCLIEFTDDGQRECISRNALKKVEGKKCLGMKDGQEKDRDERVGRI